MEVTTEPFLRLSENEMILLPLASHPEYSMFYQHTDLESSPQLHTSAAIYLTTIMIR